MIARWMLAALVFALCVGVVALAFERALRAVRRPTRWPWAIGLLAALAWPVVAALRPVAPVSAEITTEPLVPRAVQPEWKTVADAAANVADTAQRFDQALITLWVGASALLLLQIVLGVRALQRESRNARSVRLNGERVLVAQSLGPAVVGVREPRIVVPEWLLQLDAPLQSLVLRHEREHCEARDTALVWLGVGATVLMPWNVAVWWMSRRLRLAMEIDCDARTLRSEVEHTRYAKLLLLIAQRQSTPRFVPMLAESSSHLSRRISAMRSSPVKHRALKAALLVAVASVAMAVACSPRIAGNLTGPAPVAAPSVAADSATTPSSASSPGIADTGRPYFDFQVQRPAVMRPGTRGPTYTAELRAAGIQGSVLVQFVVNTDGAIEESTFKVLKSDNPLLDEAVRASLSSLTFLPAENNGMKVRQLVQQPFKFSLDGNGSGVALTSPNSGRARMPVVTPIRTDSSRTEASAQSLRASGAPSTAPAGIRPPDGSQPYFDFQVTKPVAMAEGTSGPLYPPMLRSAGVEGQVLVQFVVDTDGRAEMSTFKVLKSDNKLFEEAVREALTKMQFTRAELNGKPVKQIVQQPFAFALNR